MDGEETDFDEGNNSNIPDDTIREFYQRYSIFREGEQAAKKATKNFRLQMTKAGVNIDCFDLAFKRVTNHRDRAIEDLRDFPRYMRAGMAAYAQAELPFADERAPATAAPPAANTEAGSLNGDGAGTRAGRLGHQAGKGEAERTTNPYAPGTSSWQAWDEQFVEGRAERQRVLAAEPAPRRPRGRPRGSRNRVRDEDEAA